MSDKKLTIDEQYAELRFDFAESIGMFVVGCELNEPALIELALGNLLGMTCQFNPDNDLHMTMLFTEKEAESFLTREQKAIEILETQRTPASEQSLMFLQDIVERIHEQPVFHP